MERGPLKRDDGTYGRIDHARAAFLVLAHEVTHWCCLRNTMAEVRGHPGVAVMGHHPPDNGLIEPVRGRGHPLRCAGVELDDTTLPVPLRPELNLGSPSPRVTRQLEH